MRRRSLHAAGAMLSVVLLALTGGAAASANPISMPTLAKELQQQLAIWQDHVFAPLGSLRPPPLGSLQLPAPPCPENGLLPAPFSNCGLPELPATTLPYPGNMSYWGGHVQTVPKVYVVYSGWGEPGAFPAAASGSPETITEGPVSATLNCDPDGAGKRMADFVYQEGGPQWAGTQTQYYQTDSSGGKQYITNPANQLGGVWVDDANDASGLPKTSSNNPAGPTNTYTDLAAEAREPCSTSGSPTCRTPTS